MSAIDHVAYWTAGIPGINAGAVAGQYMNLGEYGSAALWTGIGIAEALTLGSFKGSSFLKAPSFAARTKFIINPTKFDYFFGRLVNSSKYNIARSAQNLKDLTTLGIKSESQLMRVFRRAQNGTVISTKTSQYGTTITRSVNIGNRGSINVGFFYKEGYMSTTPSITTIIPKIY